MRYTIFLFVFISVQSFAKTAIFDLDKVLLLHPVMKDFHFELGRFYRSSNSKEDKVLSIKSLQKKVDKLLIEKRNNIKSLKKELHSKRLSLYKLKNTISKAEFRKRQDRLTKDFKNSTKRLNQNYYTDRNALIENYFLSYKESEEKLEKIKLQIQKAVAFICKKNKIDNLFEDTRFSLKKDLIKASFPKEGLYFGYNEYDFFLTDFLGNSTMTPEKFQSTHEFINKTTKLQKIGMNDTELESCRSYLMNHLKENLFPSVFGEFEDLSDLTTKMIYNRFKIPSHKTLNLNKVLN